jgi:serine protease Do
MAAVTKKHEKNGKVVLGAVAVNEPKGKKKGSEVKLAKVYHGSAADKAGLRAGDVIWKIDGQRVTSASQIKRELRGEKRGSTVPVEVYRHGKREEFRVKIGAV